MKEKTAIRLLETVRVTYDTIAADFDRTRQRIWPEFDRFSRYLSRDARILDVGCGNGRLLKFLDGKFFRSYKGVDHSNALLKFARQQHRGQKISFREGNLTQLPVKDGADGVIVFDGVGFVSGSLPPLFYESVFTMDVYLRGLFA